LFGIAFVIGANVAVVTAQELCKRTPATFAGISQGTCIAIVAIGLVVGKRAALTWDTTVIGADVTVGTNKGIGSCLARTFAANVA